MALQVPSAVLLSPWAPLSTVATLAGSLCLPSNWLKVLGAWEGGRGLAEVCRCCPRCPLRVLFEDVVNEQLTRQEHAEQEPGAGALQEAWRRHLPGPGRGAQHGREVPARTGEDGG